MLALAQNVPTREPIESTKQPPAGQVHVWAWNTERPGSSEGVPGAPSAGQHSCCLIKGIFFCELNHTTETPNCAGTSHTCSHSQNAGGHEAGLGPPGILAASVPPWGPPVPVGGFRESWEELQEKLLSLLFSIIALSQPNVI